MKKSSLLGIVVLVLGMNGCVEHTYTKQSSAVILFKTPTFKYADAGFIYENPGEMKVEIYQSGQALASLQIKEGRICMSSFECMRAEEFNARVLHKAYPGSLLKEVFSSKPIFDKKGYIQNRSGFTQRIVKKGQYDINYRVLKHQVSFHDKINDIQIKVIKQQG
jgi:hypothetical protein